MIALALLLATSDTTLVAKPLFGFACRPKDTAAALPTFEYRIFLPSTDIPVSGPAKVEITKLAGVPGAPDHLILDGQMDRMQAMLSPDGTSDVRLARLAASKEVGGRKYTLDMWFGVKFVHDANGQTMFAGIAPSNGHLSVEPPDAPAASLICPDLTGRAVK